MRGLCLASLFVLVLAGFASHRSLDKIRKDGLVVGLRSGPLPFGHSNAQGQEGLEHDLAAALSRGIGARFQVVEVASQKEGEQLLQADKIDILIGRVRSTPALRERFSATSPYFRTGLGILALKSNRSIFTLSDLDARAVAAVSGSDADRLIDDFVPKARLELVRTAQEGMVLLRSGGVEALIHDRSALQAEAARDPSLRVLDVTLTEDDYVVAVGKRNGSLLAALNAEMEKLRTASSPDGQSQLSALCARYQIDPGIKPIVKQPVKPVAASVPSASPPQDIGHRLEAIERQLRELQQTLSRIDTQLERRDSGR